jgi:hypothetical protein
LAQREEERKNKGKTVKNRNMNGLLRLRRRLMETKKRAEDVNY